MTKKIVEAMADLEEDLLLSEVKKSIDEGTAPSEVISALQKGLNIVGERFASGEYFLSELIMSADLFNEASGLFGHDDVEESDDIIGTFLIGTVQSDVHDIGKNIVTSVMKSNGFKVIDIGVDVPIQDFVEAVREHNPQIVGMSCLLTTAFDSMKKTIKALEDAGLREGKYILIGGGPVDDNTKEFVGADYRCGNAQEAVVVCRKYLGVEVNE
ncbi:MAG: cobalamin B12-binding domain-containing protein [Eubacteriales bacterium]